MQERERAREAILDLIEPVGQHAVELLLPEAQQAERHLEVGLGVHDLVDGTHRTSRTVVGGSQIALESSRVVTSPRPLPQRRARTVRFSLT